MARCFKKDAPLDYSPDSSDGYDYSAALQTKPSAPMILPLPKPLAAIPALPGCGVVGVHVALESAVGPKMPAARGTLVWAVGGHYVDWLD